MSETKKLKDIKDDEIIENPDDSLSNYKRPNLVKVSDGKKKGYSITHKSYEVDKVKVPILPQDIESVPVDEHDFVVHKNSKLTTNSNTLTQKEYLVIGKAKPTLFKRLMRRIYKIINRATK